MGATKSYTSFDYEPSTMVPVIASFDTEGHISPLYVRLQGIACRVESYWECSHFMDVIEFNCKIENEHRLVPVKLTYYGREKIWVMPGEK